MTGIIIFVVWVCSGIFVMGAAFAFWQGEYPTLAVQDRDKDLRVARITGLLGPIGLVSWLLWLWITRKQLNKTWYGLKFR